jgi:hypothetical protein
VTFEQGLVADEKVSHEDVSGRVVQAEVMAVSRPWGGPPCLASWGQCGGQCGCS